jgi:hypothetical protein
VLDGSTTIHFQQRELRANDRGRTRRYGVEQLARFFHVAEVRVRFGEGLPSHRVSARRLRKSTKVCSNGSHLGDAATVAGRVICLQFAVETPGSEVPRAGHRRLLRTFDGFRGDRQHGACVLRDRSNRLRPAPLKVAARDSVLPGELVVRQQPVKVGVKNGVTPKGILRFVERALHDELQRG